MDNHHITGVECQLGGRYRSTCQCGYKSRWADSRADAVERYAAHKEQHATRTKLPWRSMIGGAK